MVTKFGNASSVDHAWGDRADIEVKQAAQHVAALTGAIPQDIIWTSGSTESINLAIQGTIHQLTRSGITPRIAVTTVEHKAVLDTYAALQSLGQIELTMIPVDHKARINLDSLEAICSQDIHLLCMMAANNEGPSTPSKLWQRSLNAMVLPTPAMHLKPPVNYQFTVKIGG